MPRHRPRDATWASLHAKLAAVPGIWKKDIERLRQFVEAVVYVLRTGVAWEDLPERFGRPNSLDRRFRRWAAAGIWDGLFTAGVPEDALATVMVDATIPKAQRRASPAGRGAAVRRTAASRAAAGPPSSAEPVIRRRSRAAPRDPRGIHALVDRRGRPLCCRLTPGQAADRCHAETLLEGVSFACLIGDRAYDPAALRLDRAAVQRFAAPGVEAVIPSQRNRKVPIPRDRGRYRTRHRIENLFGRMKDATRIVLREDKTSRRYAGFVSLAFALINIQLCP
jgi:transposase